MLCEPIYYLPQYVDTQALRESVKPAVTAQEEIQTAKTGKPDLYKVQPEFKILPTFDNLSPLKSVLSLKHNEYLMGQWHKFLDNVPDCWITIGLYTDYKKKAPVVRKMQLNGQFYGVDNKLAPIPYLPDPRQYDKIFSKKTKL